MKALGEKFRILRQRRGLNQKAMAQLLEISIPAYSKLETGITDPNFSRIVQIAAVHDLSILEFLSVGEEQASDQELMITHLKEKVQDLESSVIRLQGKLIDMYDKNDKKG